MGFLAPLGTRKADTLRLGAPLARRAPARRRPASAGLAVETLDPRIVPASLMVSDVTIVEGDAGIRYAAASVNLDARSARTVTVNYGTADGTAAVAGGDYQAISGKLTFAPGETSKTILVPVIGDRLGEPDETFAVKLKGAKNAKIADGTGVVTIRDDEPRLGVDSGAGMEGNSGRTLWTFTVSLSAAYDEAVMVDYATQDGTALAGEDYLATSGRLTFAPGETTKTITVEILGDAMPEPDETFYVILDGASANAWIANYGYVGILDDDGWWLGEPCTVNCGVDGDGGGTAP